MDNEDDEIAPADRKKSRARARVTDLATPEKPLGRIASTLARIEETEDLLATGVSPRRAASICCSKWGIGRRQAQEYVRAVHTRWVAESQTEDRETKRARLRALIMHTYGKAMERQKAVVVNVGDWQQEVEYADDPDLRSAGNMLELVGRLDGLFEQGPQSGAVNETLLQQLHVHLYGDLPREAPALPPPSVIDMEAEDE